MLLPYHHQKSKEHIKEWELDKKVVVSKMEITTPHGAMNAKSQTHNIDFYHLDTIIVISYGIFIVIVLLSSIVQFVSR